MLLFRTISYGSILNEIQNNQNYTNYKFNKVVVNFNRTNNISDGLFINLVWMSFVFCLILKLKKNVYFNL